MFLILALFTIPYYMSFLWIDDKRKQFMKSDFMYPDLNSASIASPVKSDGLFRQASEEKQPHELPPIFEINEEKEEEIAASSVVAELNGEKLPKAVRFESPDTEKQRSSE